MQSLESALEAILHAAQRLPAPGHESVALALASGRYLAQDAIASSDCPATDVSRMDGYAIRRDALPPEGPVQLPVVGRMAAGDAPRSIADAGAVRIFTGAPIPPGFDTVVMQEDVQRDGDIMRIERLPATGAWVRSRGADMRTGDRVIGRGVRLHAAHLGLLASLGWTQVPVFRRLRVAVLSTGSELTAPGEPLRPGRIYNSNGPMLRAQLEALGAQVVHQVQVPDTAAATAAALSQAAQCADLILTSGGVSVGEEDHVRAVIQAQGRLDLWKIAIKPGKPLAFGEFDAVPVIGLPGNPVSAYVTFFLIVAPYLRQRMGAEQVHVPVVRLAAGFHHRADTRRREFLRAHWSVPDGLHLCGDQTSSMLRSVAAAQFLVDVPAGQDVAPGDELDCLPLDW